MIAGRGVGGGGVGVGVGGAGGCGGLRWSGGGGVGSWRAVVKTWLQTWSFYSGGDLFLEKIFF